MVSARNHIQSLSQEQATGAPPNLELMNESLQVLVVETLIWQFCGRHSGGGCACQSSLSVPAYNTWTKTEQYKESPHIMTLDNWNGLSRKNRRGKWRRRRTSMSLHRASITGRCGIIWRGARSECPGKQEVCALTSKCGSVWVDVLVCNSS